ncbi:hypothetical protein TrVE_jg13907 [Triparma verrucosa]|uniref:Fibronectin type-III domain-containing protein n=1 Tax=Triparma verrucosa TaxID=1606542 RepID=A0A9W7B033_9STRA|nr:hypothetical protein TrVE_jg13907 [Triparma verrucosa]
MSDESPLLPDPSTPGPADQTKLLQDGELENSTTAHKEEKTALHESRSDSVPPQDDDEEKKEPACESPPTSPSTSPPNPPTPEAQNPTHPKKSKPEHPLAKFAVYRSPPAYKTPYNVEKRIYADRLMVPANYTLNRGEARIRDGPTTQFPSIHDVWDVAGLKTSAHNYGETGDLEISTEVIHGEAKSNIHISKQVVDTRTITVLSYFTLSQETAKSLPYVPHSVSNWRTRREVLLREIFSFDADVICLQDVDDFAEWWRPQMSQAGYDAIYKKRTTHLRPRQEGVVIAYKRDTFQMFRSHLLELNDAVTDDIEDRNLAERSRTDHVGIMLCLQPWEKCDDPSGVLVANVVLEEEADLEAVRMLQAQYVAQEISKFNKDFQLPIILCGALNCTPGGKVYEVLTTGLQPVDPQPPGKPIGEEVTVSLDRFHGGAAVSHSSVVLEWNECEDLDQGLSPPVEGYWVTWRIGGNQNLAFKDRRYYPKKICCKHPDQPDLRQCHVTGLASGVTYEFKVAGYNECGIGEWTKISKPIVTKRLYSKLASGPPPTKRKVVVESRHPYRPGMDLKDKVVLKGCKFGAKVEWDRKCRMEPDADILCFYEDDTYDEVLTARDMEGEEVNCVFDSEYRTNPEDFPTLVEVAHQCAGKGDLGIDKELCYGFFSDDVNEYWGYRFTVTWDDWTENILWEREIQRKKEEREGKKGNWLKELEEVKVLQQAEEEERVAAKKRVEEIRKKLNGTIIINGKETVLPVSQITPRFMDGTQNNLVAPVRKQQLTIFPEYGNRGEDPDLVEDYLKVKRERELEEEMKRLEEEKKKREAEEADEDEEEETFFKIVGQETPPPEEPSSQDLVLIEETTPLSPLMYAWHKDASRAAELIVKNETLTGVPDHLQVHFLRLKSAYRGYCAAGEPLYTAVDGRGATTSDFILGSEETLVCTEVLSIPELGHGQGEGDEIFGCADATEREMQVDMNYDLDMWDDVYQEMKEMELERRHWEREEEEAKLEEEEERKVEEEDRRKLEEWEEAKRKMSKEKTKKKLPKKPTPTPKKKKENRRKKYKKKSAWTDYRGSPQPNLCPNPLAQHAIIPNKIHPSNHFPIIAKFRFVSSHLSGFWHGGEE